MVGLLERGMMWLVGLLNIYGPLFTLSLKVFPAYGDNTHIFKNSNNKSRKMKEIIHSTIYMTIFDMYTCKYKYVRDSCIHNKIFIKWKVGCKIVIVKISQLM